MRGPRLTPYQWQVLTILTLVNFVNYVDRQIVFSLMPLIQAEFVLTYARIGLLGTVFSLVHSVCTLPLSLVADRTSRKKVISYGVIFWSAATFLSGLVPSFRALVQVRALVGVGEAAYSPAATAILTASFSRQVRARVQGVFNLGMFLGGAAGLALGGILADWAGWRGAFFVVGVPGLLLALSILRLPEPDRAAASSVEPAPPAGDKPVPIRALLRVPGYVAMLGSGLFISFAAWTYIVWGATFVNTYKGFSLREAGLILGGTLTVAGLLGVVAGAALADRLAQRYAWGRVLVIALGFLISAPLLLGSFHASSRELFLALFFLGSFFATWYHGPTTATLHDLTPARAHATAQGLYYFVVNLFSTSLAPVVIGRVADRYSLMTGMHVALAAQVAGALCYFIVIHFVRRHGLPHPALRAYGAEPAALGNPR